jgi:hypothetical protein
MPYLSSVRLFGGVLVGSTLGRRLCPDHRDPRPGLWVSAGGSRYIQPDSMRMRAEGWLGFSLMLPILVVAGAWVDAAARH